APLRHPRRQLLSSRMARAPRPHLTPETSRGWRASQVQMRSLLLLVIGAPLLAQSWYPRHNFSFGVGAGRPRAALEVPFGDSTLLSIGYGYGIRRNLQADVGMDAVFGAAKVRDFLATGFGDLRIRDYQFMVPFGARAILPLEHDRFLISAGGGGAYL